MSPLIRWDQLPIAATLPAARDWLERQADSALSAATVDAYSRAVERYLARCRELRLNPHLASTAQLARYFQELHAAGLGGAAIRQRYVAIRLFYACVVERRERVDNPLAGGLPVAGRPTPDRSPAPAPPWLPSESEWSSVLAAATSEPVRTRLMVALAYVGALRREDLCRIEVSKSELRQGRLRLSAPGVVRVILIPATVAARVDDYLGPRRSPSRLFTSESRRNADAPITVWTWAKVTRQLALRSGVPGFSSAALRHLRLIDLARAGRSAREIADFAGYRSPRLAYRYVQLARRQGVADVERRREEQVERLLDGRAS
ncbi:MAG TPA: tyrosine-type recombinase/integrase [Candidatus Dormibacteraeota bacterium]|nr:tyrosine-type recombinase/integrase [Candidatus Dormibacteraeota bacterium]